MGNSTPGGVQATPFRALIIVHFRKEADVGHLRIGPEGRWSDMTAKSTQEPIHSGHFMTSNPHSDELLPDEEVVEVSFSIDVPKIIFVTWHVNCSPRSCSFFLLTTFTCINEPNFFP